VAMAKRIIARMPIPGAHTEARIGDMALPFPRPDMT
jgi:hypothetical protein